MPDGYRVELDAYAGPLDLLLYLVRRHEIDLNDIPIAELTDQYMRHLTVIETIDVENAGEFLVMAATLLEIKSQMLMPRIEDEQEDADEDEADRPDPRVELVQQLLAYKHYKDLSVALERKHEDWRQRYAIHPAAQQEQEQDPDEAKPAELDLEDVHVMDLCEAFSRILETLGDRGDHEVTYDDTPISLHAADIVDRLGREGGLTLRRMFEGRQHRSEMIGLFLAVLELVRDNKVAVLQDVDSGDVQLSLRDDDEAPATEEGEQEHDWRNPQTGEIEYAWPDEDARKRAMRRMKLRETLKRKREAAEKGETDAGEDQALEEFDEEDWDEDEEEAWDEEDELLDEESDDLEEDTDKP